MSLKTRINPHNKPAPTPKLAQRIAEEAQLLGEEKWIIEALQKIKAQKNSLQIERLHLESMRAKVQAGLEAEQSNVKSTPAKQGTSPDVEMPDVSKNTPHSTYTMDSLEISTQNIDDFDLCNTEELNLSVTNSIFNTDRDLYAAQCDEEEDDDDFENCILDMDLLMAADDDDGSVKSNDADV